VAVAELTPTEKRSRSAASSKFAARAIARS
jgi:hypothetical protein